MKTSQKREKRSSLARNIIAVLIAVNFAGIAVYGILKKIGRNSGQVATPDGEPSADVSRALRAAGLAALEAGRYDEAVKRFTEAAKSSRASPDLTQLIQIAIDLRDKSQPSAGATAVAESPIPDEEPVKPAAVATVEKPTAVTPSPVPAPAKPAVLTREQRLREAREQKERDAREAKEAKERERQRRLAAASAAKLNREVEETVTAAPTPAPAPVLTPGTIIVSSTPSGLNVQLDGRVVDQTPVRLTAEPGPHEIQLLQGSTVVFTRRVTIAASSVMTIDPDVTAQVALLSQPARAPAPVAPAPPPSPPSEPVAAAPGLSPNGGEPKGPTNVEPVAPIAHQLIPDHLYVVANPALGLKSISQSQLADIFYGRATTLNGRTVTPILRSPSDGAGSKFFKQVLRTSVRPYRDEWQRLSAAGKGTPPSIVGNTADVWTTVNSKSGAISFVLGSEFDGASTNLRPVKISE